MLTNDWIVANIQNPEYTSGMLAQSGLDTENTQMLKEEDYLKSNFIVKNPYFADSNGNFDKDKFHNFYTESATGWKQLQDKKNIEHVYDMFDPEAPEGAQIINPLTGTTGALQTSKRKPFGDFLKTVAYNSEIGSIGLGGVNDITAPTKSAREEAQRQDIFDFKKGTFIQGTPDDQALFSNPFKFVKSLFSDPLVLATYDKDTIDIDKFTGEKVKHSKGDLKLNDNGKPYYETLAGRDPYSKQVLSSLDNLTTEDSAINKYDFFDSDDLDKSISGSIAKNLAGVVPLVFGGEVAAVYSGALVARELAKTAPMLWGMIHSLWSNESSNNSFLNGLQAKMTQISGSSSDHANANMGFTAETVLNLMGDVALQWGQQQQVAGWTRRLLGGKADYAKAIETDAKALYDKKMAEIFASATTNAEKEKALLNFGFEESYVANLLAKGGKDASDAWKMTSVGQAALKKTSLAMQPKIEKLNRLGANASLAYMALVSNTDVYHSALENGATPREAAALGFGATLAMYTVDRLGIGELFFDELSKQSAREINAAIMGNAKEWETQLLKRTANELQDANKFKRLIIGSRNKISQLLGDYADDIKHHTTGFVGKAIGEGLEEVSEDVTTDLANSTYALLHELGITSSNNIMGFGYDKDLNEGRGGYDIKGLLAKYGMSFVGGTLGGGLFYGVNTIKSGTLHAPKNSAEMLHLVNEGKAQDILDRIEEQRKRGKFGSTTVSAESVVQDSAGDNVGITINSDLSVNDYIAKQLTNQVRSYQTIMDDNNLNRSDEELFNHMIMQDKVFRSLSAYLQNESYITRYHQSWLGLANDVLVAQKGLEVAAAAKNGEIPKEILTQLDSSKSSRELIEELGEARLTDPEKRHDTSEESKRGVMVKSWQDYLADRKNALAQFESPENSAYYTEMLMFGLDDNLSSAFGIYNFTNWLFYNHGGLTEDKLTAEQLSQYKVDYESYLKTKKPLDLQKSFAGFKHFQQLVNPELENIAAVANDFKSIQGKLDDITKEPTWWMRLSNPKLRQEWETEQDFKDATTQKEGESDTDFAIRLNERNTKIQTELDNKLQEVLDFVKTTNLDPITARQLKIAFGQSAKSMKAETVRVTVGNNAKTESLLWNLIKKTVNNYSGGEIKDLKDAVTRDVYRYFSGNNSLMSFFSTDFTGSSETSLFGDNKESFGQVIKDYLISKGNVDNIPDAIKNSAATNEEAFENLFKAADKGLNNTEASTGKTYSEIFKDVFGEDELDRIDQSIISESFEEDDGEGGTDTVTLEHIDPIKWLGADALAAIEPLTTSNASTIYLKELLKNIPQEDTYTDTVGNIINTLKSTIDVAFTAAQGAIDSNKAYNILSNINVSVKNPMVELMKKLPLYDSNIEKLLTKLQDQFDQGLEPTEFVIDPADEAYIPQAQQLLQLTSAYIQAASTDQDLSNIFGHNKTINRFNKEHGIKVEPLAEIDQDYANMYQIELQKYQDALNDNKWSLPYISKQNLGNSLLLFEQSKKALLNVHKSFWDSVKNAFVVDGKNILEKYVPTGDAEEDVRQASNLFYDAIQEHPEALNTILEQFTTDIYKQETANINPNLTEAGFSDYDKAVYLITSAGIKHDDFLQSAKNFIQKHPGIVPLDSQLQIAKLGMAMVNNPKLVRSAVRHLAEKSGTKVPILDSTVFIPGIGGSGKTSVVAKMISEFAAGKKIYMAAPGETQAKNLEASLEQSGALDQEKLMALVTDYPKIKESIDNASDVDEIVNLSEKVAKDIKVKSAESGVLIFDEYTHLDTMTEMVLDKWAKENDIVIIGLGDNSQKGYVNPHNLICSNDADTVFMLRSSRLGVSLRNGNIQQVSSTQTLDAATQLVYNSSFNPTPEIVQRVYNTLHTWKPRYYNRDVFNGTYIGNDFKDWAKIFGKVTPNAEHPPVAFIGSDTAFAKLNAPADTVKRFSNIKEVQGSEFDYIIYEGDIAKIPVQRGTPLESIGDALIFARDLYTVVSRGKKGVVILTDKSSFNNVQDIGTANTTDLSAKAAEAQQSFLDYLNSLTLDTTDTAPVAPSGSTTPGTTTTTSGKTVSPDEVVAAAGVLLSASTESASTAAADSKATEDDKVQPDVTDKDRMYANFSLLGVPSNGKEWVIPQDESSYSDVGVIAHLRNETGGNLTKVSDGKTKNELVSDLLLLKDTLLRIRTSGGALKSFDQFINEMQITNGSWLFDNEAAYKTLKYQVHIREKQDTDKLVGYSKLKSSDMTIKINGKDYIATIEATWQNNGKTNTITLGALPAIETYAKAVKSYEGTPYGEMIAKNFTRYNTALSDIVLKEGGIREIKAPDNVITELKKISEPIPFALVPKVVYDDEGNIKYRSNEGDYNPDAGDSVPELLRMPYASISTPLTYFGGIPGVSASLKGRTIYLVSSKPGMGTEQLIEQYYDQKFGVHDGRVVSKKLDVRMIVPTERGVSFTGMANAVWRDRFTLPADSTHQSASNFPADAGILGMKLFAQAWNTRARAIMTMKTIEGLTSIDEMNQALQGVPQFRILDPTSSKSFYRVGWDMAETQKKYSEWLKIKGLPDTSWVSDYSPRSAKPKNQQDFENWQKSLADSDGNKLRNYLYITPDYLTHLYNITNALIEPLNDIISIQSSPESILDIKDLYKHCQEIDFETGEALFSLENGRAARVKFDSKAIEFEREVAKESTTLQSANFFKVVPLFFTKGYRFAMWGANKKSNVSGKDHYIKYKLYGKRVDPKTGEKQFFGNRKNYITLSEEALIQEARDIDDNTSFSNIMNLIFHGTSDPTGNVSGKHNFKESTAYFKNGIYHYPYCDFDSKAGYEYKGETYFRKVRGDRQNISSFFQTDMIPIPLADFDISPKTTVEDISTDTTVKELVTPSAFVSKLEDYEIESSGNYRQDIKAFMTNTKAQFAMARGDESLHIYDKGKVITYETEPSTAALTATSVSTNTTKPIIFITPTDYQQITGESFTGTETKVPIYIDDEGKVQLVSSLTSEGTKAPSESSSVSEEQILSNMKKLIEDNADGLRKEAEDFEEDTTAWEAIEQALAADDKNTKNLVEAIKNYRDSLFGEGTSFEDMDFESDLAKTFDTIIATYDETGKPVESCKIVLIK